MNREESYYYSRCRGLLQGIIPAQALRTEENRKNFQDSL
jgi:hypothetical protein